MALDLGDIEDPNYAFLRPLVSAWLSKIEMALTCQTRKKWKEVADECLMFYSKSASAMWDPLYTKKFWRGVKAPKFRVTINKAFEFTAVYLPNLLWDVPHRTVTPKKLLELPQDAFPDPQMYQAVMQMAAQESSKDKVVAQLLTGWLNYTPREMPGNGLEGHNELAVLDAMLTGMGCLSGDTEVYAKIDGRHTSLPVRELKDITGETFLWDGENWNRVVNVKITPKKGTELRLKLKSGEEISCTEDHIWPTQRGNLNARDLVVGDTLGYVKLPEPENASAPEHVPDEIGWLIGLFLGDGCYQRDKNSVFHLFCHIDDKEDHSRLERIVRSYGGNITWRGRDGGKNWNARIFSPMLSAVINQYVCDGNCFKKHLSTACLSKSDSFLASVLEGYGDSDGHWLDDERSSYRIRFCNNRMLARDLRMIASRVGVPISLKLSKDKDLNGDEMLVYRGTIRFQSVKKCGRDQLADRGEIVEICPADYRYAQYYDISVENSPHTYALSSGLLTHNCLWPAPYSMPGSDKMLTGCFHDKPSNLIIDPDFPTLQRAKWIGRKHTEVWWEVEKRFKLPPGSLKNKATMESSWHYAELASRENDGNGDRKSGKTSDLVVWYEIWSKLGTGARMTGMPSTIKNHLEEIVGDYAYLAICPDCPYPLNCPADKIRNGASSEEVRRSFEWPVPLWTDDRWPVERLTFYDDPESPYPIAPLAPALGELKAMNAIVSWLVNRTWQSSRQMYAVLGQYHDELKKVLDDGDDLGVFAVPPGNVDDVKKMIQIVENKEVNKDTWAVLEILSNNFDKRMGMTPFVYGQNEDGTQDRTASTTEARKSAVSARPEYMQKKVVGWQSRVASVEAMLTWLFVKAPDVLPLMGQAGAMLWKEHIENADAESVMRQMSYEVAASSVRRPNRERDISDLSQLSDKLIPLIQARGQLTGDYEQANGYLKRWGELHDMDMEGLLFPAHDPNSPENQLQQAMQQAELQKTQAEAQKLQSEAQQNPAALKAQELQMEQMNERERMAMEQQSEEARLAMEVKKLEMELQAKMAELQIKIKEKQLDMEFKAQEHAQSMQQTQAEGAVNLAVQKEQGATQIAASRQQAQQQTEQHNQAMKQQKQAGAVKVETTKAQSDAKVSAMKKQAAAKPKGKAA